MKRWLAIVLFGFLGLGLLTVALFVPAYFRALDSRVVVAAGQGSLSLAEEGLEFVRAAKIGPARMLVQVATNFSHASASHLIDSLEQVADPSLRTWGDAAPDLDRIFQHDARFGQTEGKPILGWLLSSEGREKALAYLSASQRLGVREVLRTRALTNLVHFAPVESLTGQPLDAITLLTALLLQSDELPRPLKEAFETAAVVALRRGEVTALESSYLDLLALSNRLDWGQLTELLRRIPSLDALRQVANVLRRNPNEFPIVYAAIVTVSSPTDVLDYLARFGANALPDLKFSLGCGTEAVAFVVAQQKRIYHAGWQTRFTQSTPGSVFVSRSVNLTLQQSGLILAAKYLLVLMSGFFLAHSAAWLIPNLRGKRYRWLSANQIVFIGCFLILMLSAAEPFLTRVRPISASAGQRLAAGGSESKLVAKGNSMLDLFSVVAVIAFLVVQGVLYALCLSKLAEIRRQPISSQLKLKLLENEGNLFDAGLYAGLAGTAGSLVLLAMGFIKPSLTAAYASTLFGILFVAVLKIGHLRPYRRTLILTSETGTR
ncbi:MAG TPA: hypothetical protein VK633_07490 [Verrucomicrobiae bacterium]|nr:hypothetical protein [Verrucomicrobiae bacterium]